MIVLAFDTALESCSAAVLDGDQVLAARSETMARGHQERLGALVREAMAEAGTPFPALGRIGVTIGPGSFTGLRVGLAFAKGLGFALARPVVGVGTLQALASSVDGALVAAAVDARRGQVWLQLFSPLGPMTPPEALEPEVAAARLVDTVGDARCTLVGSAAAQLAPALAQSRVEPRLAPDPVVVARLAAAAPESTGALRPLYLRAPDAKLPGGAA